MHVSVDEGELGPLEMGCGTWMNVVVTAHQNSHRASTEGPLSGAPSIPTSMTVTMSLSPYATEFVPSPQTSDDERDGAPQPPSGFKSHRDV